MADALRQRLAGVWAPVLTPCARSGWGVAVPLLASLSRALVAAGARGITLFGSTSEAVSVDDAERMRTLDALADTVPPGAHPSSISVFSDQPHERESHLIAIGSPSCIHLGLC
jgi:hypothetical protein